MKIFAHIFNHIKPFLISQTFWTALAAIGTIPTLYFIYKQIKNARNVAAYEFLRKEDDRFRLEEMQLDRSKLAKILLLRPDQYEEIDEYADYVLDYFEDLGLMLRENLASEYFIWTMNSYYVLHYWGVLVKYIEWVRKDRNDPTYYCDFEYLYKKVLKFEKKIRNKNKIEFTSNELRDFLQEELHVQLRPFLPSDLDSITEIEESSFKVDAYPKSQFKELYKEHPDGFFVAEIFGEVVGYVIGYISGEIGEFDSLAVGPRFRNLRIGRRLSELVLKRFREEGITTCSLEVYTANDVAIHFYEEMGFKIAETLKNYYDDGSDAYLMKMKILSTGSSIGAPC